MSHLKPLENYIVNESDKPPSQSDFTTVYYYLHGKLVGDRVTIDGGYEYHTFVGTKKTVKTETDIDYAVREIVVDRDAYNAQIKVYSTKRSNLVSDFINDTAQEYSMTVGEVKYFYNRFRHNGFKSVIDEIEDFKDSLL